MKRAIPLSMLAVLFAVGSAACDFDDDHDGPRRRGKIAYPSGSSSSGSAETVTKYPSESTTEDDGRTTATPQIGAADASADTATDAGADPDAGEE